MSPLRRFAAGTAVFGAAMVTAFFGVGLVKDVQFASAQKQVEATREQLASVEDLATPARDAFGEYVRRVQDGTYPGPEHAYPMSDAEREKFRSVV